MEDIGFTKSQLFFVSQPSTVYEVDFLNLDMILDGFKTGNHSVWTFLAFFPGPSKKWGAQPKFWLFFQTMISCFKAMPSFFFKKTISSNEYFWFLCISLIEYLSTFSHLNFFSCVVLNHLWLLNVLECWPFLIRCWFKNTTYILLGGAKRFFSFFLQKKFFLKKKKREKTQKREKKPK